jgi:hypothetical protein
VRPEGGGQVAFKGRERSFELGERSLNVLVRRFSSEFSEFGVVFVTLDISFGLEYVHHGLPKLLQRGVLEGSLRLLNRLPPRLALVGDGGADFLERTEVIEVHLKGKKLLDNDRTRKRNVTQDRLYPRTESGYIRTHAKYRYRDVKAGLATAFLPDAAHFYKQCPDEAKMTLTSAAVLEVGGAPEPGEETEER